MYQKLPEIIEDNSSHLGRRIIENQLHDSSVRSIIPRPPRESEGGQVSSPFVLSDYQLQAIRADSLYIWDDFKYARYP